MMANMQRPLAFDGFYIVYLNLITFFKVRFVSSVKVRSSITNQFSFLANENIRHLLHGTMVFKIFEFLSYKRIPHFAISFALQMMRTMTAM